VQDGRADVAVHSAKDLTAELAPDCSIICVPARAPAFDVVVGGRGQSGEERLATLPQGARVGTSSMRRRVLVREMHPELEIAELRGNLDSRLRRVAEGEVEAAVLAAAGIERLGGVDPGLYGALDPERWVPAPAQGALAVEALTERDDLSGLFAPLGDPSSAAAVACERAFSARLEGGCSVPLGCLARPGAAGLVATGLLGSPYGDEVLRDRISGPLAHAERLGAELADAILGSGGRDILDDIKAGDELEEVSEP
ncbi:MAG: hydroxymethylbilane synthase, partial [Actinomycetota bacterium]